MEREPFQAIKRPYMFSDSENAEIFSEECRCLLDQYREWKQLQRASAVLWDLWLLDQSQHHLKREYDRLNETVKTLQRILKSNRQVLANHPDRPRNLVAV